MNYIALKKTEIMNKLKHFHSIQDINTYSMINGLLLKAIFFAKNQDQLPVYKDTTIAQLFMEPSTRTQLSFEIACQKLGINTVQLNSQQSSLKKDESFEDTLQTLEAMGISGAIIRSTDDLLIKRHLPNRKLSMINAGSGVSSHPSQAMLDLLTIYNHFNRIDNLKISIIGDVNHSRVANSNIELHKILNNTICICGPDAFTNKVDKNIKRVSLEDALKDSDIIIFLRIQFERHQNLEINKEEYIQNYSLNNHSILNLNKSAIILHPGPVNRDLEIASNLIGHSQVKILNQVTNSIPMRMAIIDHILGSQHARSTH